MCPRGRDKAAGSGDKTNAAPLLPTVLTISMAYTSGLVFPPQQWTDDAALGTLSFVMWLRAIKYLDATGGRMVVVERDPRQDAESIREFALSEADVDRVLGAMKAIGLPARVQHIEPRLDSSDRWAHLTLNIATRDHRRTLDVDMNTSSYEGEDAPRLREFLQTLLHCAGARDPGVWYDLTGHWRSKD